MTQRAFCKYIAQIFSKAPKKKNISNNTDDYLIDDTWSLDISDLFGYGPEKITGYRYVLNMIDNFSKFAWTDLLKSKNAQPNTNFFDNVLLTSKKPASIETDQGKNLYRKSLLISYKPKTLKDGPEKRGIPLWSFNGVFQIFKGTFTNLPWKSVFEQYDGNCTDVSPTKTRQFFNRIHSATKSTQSKFF